MCVQITNASSDDVRFADKERARLKRISARIDSNGTGYVARPTQAKSTQWIYATRILQSAMMFTYQTPIARRDDQDGAARNKRANI
jgi:hypothetical protein